MAWTFELTDLKQNRLAEIRNAYDRSVFLGLSKIDTATCRLRIDNAVVPTVLSSDCMVKVWDDKTLRFWGPVISNEIAVDPVQGPSVVVNAASPFWRLAKRLAGKSGAGTTFTSADRADISKQLIDTTNAENDTQIQSVPILSGSTATFIAGPYQPISQCIQALSQTVDGFDWYMQYLDGVAGKIARFQGAAIVGGQQRDTVFEYGVGRANMRGFTLQQSWDGLLNQGFHIPDDGPASPAGVTSVNDAQSIADRGLYEGTVDSQNISDATLRQNLVSENVRVRKIPRLVVTMIPDFPDPGRPGRVPTYGTDYNLGDYVRGRGQYGTGPVLFDGFMRVYAVKISIDNEGKVTAEPTLVDEDGSSTP